MSARDTFGGEREGAVRYVDALKEHWLLITALVVLAVGAAAAYAFAAEDVYEAHTDVLVTPVAADDPTFIGFSLLREGDAQARPVLTAARLVETPQVADAVAERLHFDSREDALDAVQVTPVSQANILTITAESSNPARAAQIANAFADETIAQRSSVFQGELQATIRRLREELQPLPAAQRDSAEAVAIQQRLGGLTALLGNRDPTLQVVSEAVAPADPVWPRPVLSIAVALLASLLLGIGIALALELLNPRVNREDELLLEQRLPILARVPRMPRRVVRGYLAGREPLPGNVREAYRTVRANLQSAGRDERFPQVVLTTSAVPGEGKTMTSVNLAITLSLAGYRVILVDGDLRRPMVATVFGVAAPPHGFADVLLGRVPLEEALVEAPGHGEQLRLLLASPEHAHLIDLLEPDRVERVLTDLRLAADVVIVDSPPLTEVADALNLADDADALLVAVRLGHTRRDRLNELRRMLAQRGVAPTGFVVTTRRQRRGGGYYYGTDSAQRMRGPRGTTESAVDGAAAGRQTAPPARTASRDDDDF